MEELIKAINKADSFILKETIGDLTDLLNTISECDRSVGIFPAPDGEIELIRLFKDVLENRKCGTGLPNG